jgi:hypothetical protein
LLLLLLLLLKLLLLHPEATQAPVSLKNWPEPWSLLPALPS